MNDETEPTHPAWLKAMQNGTLAEARARAFLLERFWVLERSVDIDGADFIIQRRITGRNLLDREAPRLGVVQVKFFGTELTRHLVHREYVLDESGDPREEFFLLCHAGDESHPRAFIASGREVHETFKLAAVDGRECYIITYRKLTSTGEFEIKNSKNALDRIEHQLEIAEFTKNRRFVSWALPSASQDLEAIAPIYREPVENWWGSIPEGFTRLKRVARRAMCDVEHIYNLLREISQTTDPLDAELLVAEIADHCRSGNNQWSIRIPSEIHCQELFDVSRRHKNMIERLRADGLLDRFLAVGEQLRRAVIDDLEPLLPLGPNQVHLFVVAYDPSTLEVRGVSSTVEAAEHYFGTANLDRYGHVDVPGGEIGVRALEPGRLACHWLPGRWYREPDPGLSLADTIRNSDIRVLRDCADAMFELKYGDDDGG